MKQPEAFLDSDGFPWSLEGIQWRTTPDTYRGLYTKPFYQPLDEKIIGQLTTNEKFSSVESPLLLEFARAIEALHGIKKVKNGCLHCEESICETCWPLKKEL